MTTSTKPAPSKKGASASSLPEEKEEVVVEPDLPTSEPSPTPAGPVEDPVDPAEAEAAAAAEAARAEDRTEYDRLLAAMPPDEPVYVAGERAPRLKVGRYFIPVGEIVPGAHHWPRREAYERLGRIERR